MNLQYYYNFVTIVEEGSLTAAARKLHVAQPALSNQVKAMEQKYGTSLFYRGSRKMGLTDAGNILYQQSKRICEIEQSARNQIASGFSGQRGTLRVGVIPSVAGRSAMRVLLDFAQKYPDTEIQFLEANEVDLCRMLQTGLIEVAILKTVRDLPQNVHVVNVKSDPTVALYKPGAGLLDHIEGDSVTVGQLSRVPVAMEELLLDPVRAAFKAVDAELYLKSLSSSPTVALHLAAVGHAVALVSSMAADAFLVDGLAVKEIADGGALSARYCLLVQQGNYRSQLANNYLRLLAEALKVDLSCTLPPVEEEQ